MAGKQTETPTRKPQQRDESRLTRRTPFLMSPFALLQQFFNDELLGNAPARAWTPKIDVVQRGNELVIRADLPGVNPDDVVVEIGDQAVTVSGERRQEREEEEGGFYRVERTHGSFYREIPLPDGAMTDQAHAEFKDGVLEIKVPAPPENVARGRRLEIHRGNNGNRNT